MDTSRTVTRLLTAGAVSTLAVALAGCMSFTAPSTVERDADSQEVVEGGNADVFAIAVGDCFTEVTETEINQLPVVPCGESHDYEVFHLFDMPDGDWPGAEAVDAAAEEGCLAAFEPFVGVSYEESVFIADSIDPSEQSWGDGDREIICILSDPSGPTEGSAEGTAR